MRNQASNTDGKYSEVTPLLKWAGGKRLLLRYLIGLIPNSFKRYYEPFFGGGALFFALQPRSATISDNNKELINCYIQVRDHPNDVIEYLSRFKNTEREYYKIRECIPRNQVGRAARIIYLTTLSFNGIYRTNLKGIFNVPYGYKVYLQPSNPLSIHAASKALSYAELVCDDFANVIISAKKGDLIYLDPPYTVAHGNNGFLKYNARIFSWDDQKKLSDIAKMLVKRGCKVIISNANHRSILSLYNGFNNILVERHSVIAASAKYRQSVKECIFFN